MAVAMESNPRQASFLAIVAGEERCLGLIWDAFPFLPSFIPCESKFLFSLSQMVVKGCYLSRPVRGGFFPGVGFHSNMFHVVLN